MNWFYAEDGRQLGPVDDAQFDALVHGGKIQAATLVWHQGMENWKPYGEIAPPSPAGSLTAPPFASLSPDDAMCSECGRVFARDAMIRHGDRWICAECKPVFLQKLAEGVPAAPTALRYAGFWIRVAAAIIDGLLLGVVNVALGMLVGFALGSRFMLSPNPDPQQLGRFIIFEAVLYFLGLAIGATYETLMVGKYGATLGKMACGLKVVTPEGEPISYLKAFGRYFAKMLSYLICYIGCIMVGFDDEKRGLHDRICNTRVIFK